jgi:hypothetical protein
MVGTFQEDGVDPPDGCPVPARRRLQQLRHLARVLFADRYVES